MSGSQVLSFVVAVSEGGCRQISWEGSVRWLSYRYNVLLRYRGLQDIV